MSVVANAMCHIGSVRKTNEDTVLDYPDAGLWAIADGMGGHQGGELASQWLIDHIAETGHHTRGAALVDAVKEAIQTAHMQIFDYSQSLPQQPIMGSTIVVLILEGDQYHCIWSGDSRCYLLRDGCFKAITVDHTEAEELIAKGAMPQFLPDAIHRRVENTLTHAIGIDNQPAYLEYQTGFTYEHDCFYLCSDGINKVFSDMEIQERLLSNSPQRSNLLFVKESLEKNAPDNLSSIIVNL